MIQHFLLALILVLLWAPLFTVTAVLAQLVEEEHNEPFHIRIASDIDWAFRALLGWNKEEEEDEEFAGDRETGPLRSWLERRWVGSVESEEETESESDEEESDNEMKDDDEGELVIPDEFGRAALGVTVDVR
mmetsp:Transcript_6054/g.14689  ORF Transcript_6054/g.14689 Transcript_6054/m.14689 type:complete len:132 (+) Transcript_6054:76-471(+)|eukprot:CAMPEP_0198348908 /NCGR_PEP_ID=MMETSP1450-20131203/91759_1 /TAXON_ID=753684 ORGANISM="Madagascaria erythrocladiodes, Strain CCMP3234" /NCGR_SAMPLE_ID=MMETSP1450 /ASSEMBLY_ACC=CAM_ASM_001115 /LENGTH=131 /DNA_ID=CAMNT_0044054553 /DNA_START=71 /DNA_END=466 /DNA_ORIENTATION=+